MSAILDRLPALATTGVGSLPFTSLADAARHAMSAYTLPFSRSSHSSTATW